MLRSMASAISALRNHQTFMDVVSTNIANINTTGFKSSRVTFQDLLSQTLASASAPTDTSGGVNPIQVGMGMRLGSIDTIFTQGNPRATGQPRDLAIQGDGFFVLQQGDATYYSRDGVIDVGTDNTLVNPSTGMRLMGWMADASGAINTGQPVGPLTIPYGAGEARATTEVTYEGNLDAEAQEGDTVEATIPVYDSLGEIHALTLTFTKTANDREWTWAVTAPAGVTVSNPTGTTISFDTNGMYTSPDTTTIDLSGFDNGAGDMTGLVLDFSALSQLAKPSEVGATNQDGLSAGTLTDFSVNEFGQIIGMYSNGMSRVVGQVALASFNNPAGLLRMGQNLFFPSANSGTANVGAPGEGTRGTVWSGYLESSNVDLAREFTDMIIAQRGFQANSRVVTTSDEILQELVNLKR
ncbi:MAG TPA: flagellar hook protein FlgE [Chloroflexi bacterium]|jgi:flagellar hook protein FlgE|nr:flagellar hook protein FlgE [Chloroflexota bacterium]